MTTPEFPGSVEQKASDLAQQADAALRENPIPAIITAVAVGFGIGLLVRTLQHEEPHPVRDCLDETRGYLRDAWRPLQKTAKRAYADSSKAVREAVDELPELELDPIAKWWKRLWA
jgi:hypothetical protein